MPRLVVSAREMPDENFRLHLKLRHPGLIRAERASRTEHDSAHARSPASWLNHVHEEAGEPEPEPAHHFWYSPAHP